MPEGSTSLACQAQDRFISERLTDRQFDAGQFFSRKGRPSGQETELPEIGGLAAAREWLSLLQQNKVCGWKRIAMGWFM